MTTTVIQASRRVAGVVEVDAQPFTNQPPRPMSVAGEDLPDRADHVPRDQQRQRHEHERSETPQPRAGMASAMAMPSGISIARMVPRRSPGG
jgi:hypothetical protein